MNFPAIAKKTYDVLKDQITYSSITQFIIEHLKKMKSPLERARFVHNVVDEYNSTVFAHPLVKELSPCKSGCSACCHTQVSVTEDEARLLVSRINEGVKIDYSRLQKQTKVGNCSDSFYQLSYEDRKCIFLGANKSCLVYNDRPSVCRTNTVIGSPSQCSTLEGIKDNQAIRLVKTPHSDMAIIGSFMAANSSGAMALMISNILSMTKTTTLLKSTRNIKKSVFNDTEL